MSLGWGDELHVSQPVGHRQSAIRWEKRIVVDLVAIGRFQSCLVLTRPFETVVVPH